MMHFARVAKWHTKRLGLFGGDPRHLGDRFQLRDVPEMQIRMCMQALISLYPCPSRKMRSAALYPTALRAT